LERFTREIKKIISRGLGVDERMMLKCGSQAHRREMEREGGDGSDGTISSSGPL
jgi:hypothetical protein